MLENNPNPRQSRQQKNVYVSYNPDLAELLDGEEGTFEVVQGNQVFIATCKQGHSITSLIPAGNRAAWIVTPVQNAEAAQFSEQSSERGGGRSRAASA